MTPQAIELKGIRKSFGATDVLREIDLAIQPGEFVSLVGMSGCGKSTLLRILAGLESPTAGQVAIGGTDVTDVDPSDRNLAMVFQSYALYPHMTVRQNIATPLRMRQMSLLHRLPVIGRLTRDASVMADIARAVEHAAETLEISHLLDRKPAALSGGQRQRVALARALVREPAAFLMDEPLSNLDAKLRAHMRSELSQLHRRLGATFVYVTHDQVEAMTMSDRIALMFEGRIAQLGTPDDLYNTPASLDVARFIGQPTINLMPVEIGATGRLSALGIDLPLAATPGREASATLGLRSEDLHQCTDGFAAKVLFTEMHGADRYVTCQPTAAPDVRLVMRLRAGEALQADSMSIVRLGCAYERAHLFGADGARRALHVLDRVAA